MIEPDVTWVLHDILHRSIPRDNDEGDDTYSSLSQPAAPTVANSTPAGSYPAVQRYYKVMWRKKTGSQIDLQSDTSTASLAFTPSGAKDAAVVTRGALPGLGETHWAVYASTDGTNYYDIGETAVANTTYSDSALVATYSSGNPEPSALQVTKADQRDMNGVFMRWLATCKGTQGWQATGAVDIMTAMWMKLKP